MGDFFLDFRPLPERKSRQAAEALRFLPDVEVARFEEASFSLVLTSVDNPQVWGPYRSQERHILVALCGRVAFEEEEWELARAVPGDGGLACKAIFKRYCAGGIQSLEQLNGSFVVFINDGPSQRAHLVTDRFGMSLAYCRKPVEQAQVFCSHPDVLAAVLGEDQFLDTVSLAEFLMTGRLTFPYTYFQNIEGVPSGSALSFCLRSSARLESTRQYFQFRFQIDACQTLENSAERLASAFEHAVRRRTLPLFGLTAIGLSGGMDSRVILSSANPKSSLRAFTLFDQENIELRTARRIAHACGVPFTALQRDFEYYARNAQLGVRISGGTGNIASNHFLGIRDQCRAWGVSNLLTGCYCDYLFKGLSINITEGRLTRVEALGQFDFQYYRPCYWPNTSLQAQVRERLQRLFPEAGCADRLSQEDWLNVERKRAFPLAYEGDLTQRTIPQRVMPWFLPIADNDLMDVYLATPSRFKLNSALFRKMALILCNETVRGVPDSNTGAPLGASAIRNSVHRYLSAMANRVRPLFTPQQATRGSWPNWEFYVAHSPMIQALWSAKNELARDLFIRVTGTDAFAKPLASYKGRQVEFFMRLFTQKLWLDQRATPGRWNPEQAKSALPAQGTQPLAVRSGSFTAG